MVAKVYRKIVPEELRCRIYNAFLGNILRFVRNLIDEFRCKYFLLYYSVNPPKTEKEQAYKNLGKIGFSAYPYIWGKEYYKQKKEVRIDKNNGLPYVVHSGKKLYFRRDDTDLVELSYKRLLIEQDKRSAHRYVDSYDELKGKILLDIGAAEAIFTLNAIDYIRHAYLFECDEKWIKALEATFAPWKEKVTIVRKYVSDVNDEYSLTLDAFFCDNKIDNLFFKMDIEGYERKALKGAKFLLKSSVGISGSICIYHLHDDLDVIKKILVNTGLNIKVQPGFLYYQNEMRSAIMRFYS